MNYRVIISELCIEEFEIGADSLEEAKQKSIMLYNQGRLLLEDSEVVETKLMVMDEAGNEEIDWEVI